MLYDQRQRIRTMLAAELQTRMYGPFIPTSSMFLARFPQACFSCGMLIEVGDQAVHAKRDEGGDVFNDRVVHAFCPTLEERFAELFKVDGDLVRYRFVNALPQNCSVCGRNGVGADIVQVMTPDGTTTYKHWGCRQRSYGVS